ncbi:MAG: hypothetical protein JKY89_00990 [Immundisolibacteraceae bacterium]|nr:hypothetical protein [Immundisolibacteraceae bacterium]
MNDILYIYFSREGNIGRSTYFFSTAFLLVPIKFLEFLMQAESTSMKLLFPVAILGLLYISFNVACKRTNDIGIYKLHYQILLYLSMFIPLAGLLPALYIWLAPTKTSSTL